MKTLSGVFLLIMMASFLAHGQSSSETTRPKIIQGPVVVATGDNWAVVEWTTNAAGRSSSIIFAGTDKSDLRAVAQTAEPVKMSEIASYQEQQYTHLVRLNDLEPGTTYYFRVDSGSGYETGTSSILPLTTTRRRGLTNWGAAITDHQ
jgi:phosphodiesterase/alkaline phosphatase D-like protein